MIIRLLNMGFFLQDGVYVKANTDVVVTITSSTFTVDTSTEHVENVSIDALEEFILENYGDEL